MSSSLRSITSFGGFVLQAGRVGVGERQRGKGWGAAEGACDVVGIQPVQLLVFVNMLALHLFHCV